MSIHTLHDESFHYVIGSSPIPVVVLFTSPTCIPCKSMMPILHEIADEFEGEIYVTQLDITASPKTTQKYAISSVPTVLVFNEGKAVETVIGVQSVGKICDTIEAILTNEME